MATTKGQGKEFRTDISLKKLMAMFPTEDEARVWFQAHIWPDGGARQGFIRERVEPAATLRIDKARACARMRKAGQY